MNKKVATLLNDQINKEFFSAYLYLSFANYFDEVGLAGFANWFTVQAQEERDHAMLFVKYMQNNDIKVTYEQIAKPDNSLSDTLEILKASLEHEIFITNSINDIYALALENKDFRTTQFLDWFIKEQGEEEMNARDLIQRVEIIGDSGKGIFIFDQELAKRVYTPASLVL
ncbi:MAG: ferritin [Pleomorphochaeta sp.]